MSDGRDARALLPLIVADIFDLAGRFRASGEAIAAGAGQTQARWQVMSAASGAPVTVAQIARRLGVTRQNVQRVANLLVREGWASFAPNPEHRGSPHLLLSPRGRAALARLSQAAARAHAKLARRLEGAGIAALHRGLRRLLAAMRQGEAL